MKTLKEEVHLNCSADELWTILSDIGRSDWVPTIEKISLEGDCRHFEMTGMGKITEKILKQVQNQDKDKKMINDEKVSKKKVETKKTEVKKSPSKTIKNKSASKKTKKVSKK